MEKRGKSTAVLFRASSALKEFALGTTLADVALQKRGGKQQHPGTPKMRRFMTLAEEIMTYISSGSFPALKLPELEFLVLLFLRCAGWFCQEWMIA